MSFLLKVLPNHIFQIIQNNFRTIIVSIIGIATCYFIGLTNLLNNLKLDMVEFILTENKVLLPTLTLFCLIMAFLLSLISGSARSSTNNFIKYLKHQAPDVEKMIHACVMRNIVGSTRIMKDPNFIRAFIKNSAFFFPVSIIYFLYLIFFTGEKLITFLLLLSTGLLFQVAPFRTQHLVKLLISLHLITLYGAYTYLATWCFLPGESLIIYKVLAYIISLFFSFLIAACLIINQKCRDCQLAVSLGVVLTSSLAFSSTLIKGIFLFLGISSINNIDVVEINTNKKIMSGILTLKTSKKITVKDENLKTHVFSTSQYYTHKPEEGTDTD